MNLTLSLACRPPCHPISPSCWSTSKEALGQPPPGRITCRLWKKSNLLLFILRQFVVDLLRHPLPARVGQIGPDELFLRETENAKAAAAPQGVVKLVPRIRHNFCPLENPRRNEYCTATRDRFKNSLKNEWVRNMSSTAPESDEADLGTVDEQPAISDLVSQSNFYLMERL